LSNAGKNRPCDAYGNVTFGDQLSYTVIVGPRVFVTAPHERTPDCAVI
jgi:hypothetical protein